MKENDILGQYNLPYEAEMRHYQQNILSYYNMPQKVELFYFQLNETLWQYKFRPVDSLNRNASLLYMAKNLQGYIIPPEMIIKNAAEIFILESQRVVDKNPYVGTNMTRYYNDKGELLFATNDGLSAIIIVPDGNIRALESKLNETNANGTINNSETNKKEMHSLGKTPEEYSNYVTQGLSDYWAKGYKETYEKAYYNIETSQFSWEQILSNIVAAIASENEDSSGYDRHAGRAAGIMNGNSDRKNGKINRLNPSTSFRNNEPLIILKSKSLQK